MNAYKNEMTLYTSCLGHTDIDFPKELPSKKVGRSLATGDDVDQQIQHFLLEIRKKGLPVNTSIAIGAGEGILLNKNAGLSTDILTKEWVKYLIKRMGLVKRKGTTKAKVDVDKFFEVERLFLQDIKTVVTMDDVPAELVINWDQTGLNYVPVSEWTMEKEGSKRVPIDGKDDKRQITAVFGCSLTGDFLLLQLVYQGKTTNACHPFSFPTRLEYHTYRESLV